MNIEAAANTQLGMVGMKIEKQQMENEAKVVEDALQSTKEIAKQSSNNKVDLRV